MSRQIHTKRLLILGNGFDLDLGMKSSYSNFANSDIWKRQIEGNAVAMSHKGLLKTLVQAKEQDCWFDIEQTMMNYVRRLQHLAEKTNYDYDSYEDDEKDYHIVCSALKDYLRQESQQFTPKNASIAEDAIKELLLKGMFHKIYTFNYTDVTEILRKKLYLQDVTPDVVYVHGSLNPPDDIILGVEGGDIIPEPYKFLYKTSSRYYRSSNLYSDLDDAYEIVFFGHSVNGMDFDYFSDFFSKQSSDIITGHKRKWIRIFTADTASMQDIKYNLRENNINLNLLYLLNDFDIIQCRDLENGDAWEKRKYVQFTVDIANLKNRVGGIPATFTNTDIRK